MDRQTSNRVPLQVDIADVAEFYTQTQTATGDPIMSLAGRSKSLLVRPAVAFALLQQLAGLLMSGPRHFLFSHTSQSFSPTSSHLPATNPAVSLANSLRFSGATNGLASSIATDALLRKTRAFATLEASNRA